MIFLLIFVRDLLPYTEQ